jgi:hypothetical protein
MPGSPTPYKVERRLLEKFFKDLPNDTRSWEVKLLHLTHSFDSLADTWDRDDVFGKISDLEKALNTAVQILDELPSRVRIALEDRFLNNPDYLMDDASDRTPLLCDYLFLLKMRADGETAHGSNIYAAARKANKPLSDSKLLPDGRRKWHSAILAKYAESAWLTFKDRNAKRFPVEFNMNYKEVGNKLRHIDFLHDVLAYAEVGVTPRSALRSCRELENIQQT